MSRFDVAVGRLDISLDRMGEYFPSFSIAGLPIGTGPDAVWKGVVQPIICSKNLNDILDDIFHEKPVLMRAGGTLQHRDDCVENHCHHEWMNKIKNPFVRYKLEIRYGGGEAHPRAYVREPTVPLYKRSKHHLADGAICAYPPWMDIWDWQRHTVVDFMTHSIEWLVKWTVWDQARVWIGPEMPHDASFLLREIPSNAQCHCGSGRQYKDCHRSEDEARVMNTIARITRLPTLSTNRLLHFPLGDQSSSVGA